MLFNSLIFTIFLPIVFIGYWLLPHRFRNYFLLLASYYFYYSYNPYFLLLLIFTSGFDYWCTQQIYNTNHKRFYLVLSLFVNLGVLFIFKYFVFFYNSAVYSFNWQTKLLNQLVIPAGLSFYTFQSMSYVIDVYREKYKPKESLYDFLLFVSFFPHMVAGPIVRYNDLMPQLKLKHYFNQINWEAAFKLISWGFFKKLVVADNLDDIVAPIYSNPTGFNSFELLITAIAFMIQVYADFSGYSDIATGVAKLFNINLSLNWRRPLLSASLHEFWTRNHISITNWFKDYLYIGLGGNRVGKLRWLLNIFLVFVISAMWHGANFTFLVWGLWHAVFFILEILFLMRFKEFVFPKVLGWVYLITIHCISLIAFRANSMVDLIYIYKRLFNFDFNFQVNELIKLNDLSLYLVCVSAVIILMFKDILEEWPLILNKKLHDCFLKPAFYILILILIFTVGDFNSNAFIYFQF
ncbi:MAG: MBOAT family O-acyltransferase [Bacteroidota bacterium]